MQPTSSYTISRSSFVANEANFNSVIHLVETFGHSGIAAHLTNPFLPFFSLFGIDLSIEDHDLHHRKLVGNFGK